jgi:hypothetical protein
LKDHGPIVFYDVAYQDATVRFSFKPKGAKSVVFTANGAVGYLFRFVMGATGTSIRAFPAAAKEHTSISLGREKVVLKPGEWTPLMILLRGNKATVKIGDAPEKTCGQPRLRDRRQT